LRIVASGQSLTAAWPLWATNFVLQESGDFLLPSSWTLSPATPTPSNNESVVTVPLTSTNKYYRLFKP
jgi:hypothetical protein